MRRPLDWLLTTDPVQRVRLAQAGMAMVMLAIGVLAMQYFVWVGVVAAGPALAWTALALGGMLIFFGLIRSGWSRRLDEPSMTVPQMLYALSCGALAYALLGPARGGVFPIVMVVMAFGLFAASPRQMVWVSVYGVLVFAVAIGLLVWHDPKRYPPGIEAGHFLMIATMLPAMSVLAARVAQMRRRMRDKRDELADALARIRELATRDELTALINRRHMQELMEQEHQRCIRSGQVFCLAKLDIDHFKAVNDAHGYAVGDMVLRTISLEAMRQVRTSDVLARWSGEEFLLMLPDTRAALARGGLERLVARLSALRIVNGGATVGVALSAGLAEHHAGESVEQTLERAAAALADAKAEGGGRVKTA